MEAEFSARSVQLEDHDLASGNQASAAPATAFIVERVPVSKFVEVTNRIEFVFRGEAKGIGGAHAEAGSVCRLASTIGPGTAAGIG